MADIGVKDEELYLKWLRVYFRMGNDNSFKKHGMWFPNPLRRKSTRLNRKDVEHTFKAGDKFPRPQGTSWEAFVEAAKPTKFDADESYMLAELAHSGVAMNVYFEYEEVVRAN
eukprot:COSAG06_NODE_34090_length_480_cov_0.448819_1_plen_112_part_10